MKSLKMVLRESLTVLGSVSLSGRTGQNGLACPSRVGGRTSTEPVRGGRGGSRSRSGERGALQAWGAEQPWPRESCLPPEGLAPLPFHSLDAQHLSTLFQQVSSFRRSLEYSF